MLVIGHIGHKMSQDKGWTIQGWVRFGQTDLHHIKGGVKLESVENRTGHLIFLIYRE